MYAIIKDGGKQYKVAPDEFIEVELKDADKGDSVEFGEVVYFADGDKVEVGTPLVKGITVKGEVVRNLKGQKITVFKFRRRKDSRRKQGHRQKYTRVKITEISKN